MDIKQLTSVTERYLNSKNKDFKKDFKCMSQELDKYSPSDEDVEMWVKLKKKVANHFLSLLTTKGILVKDTIEPTDFTRIGYNLLQEWLYMSEGDKKLEELETLIRNADTSSIVVILSMTNSIKLKKAKVLQAMGKEQEVEKLFQPPTTDGEIPTYVQEAIDTLSNNTFHSVEDLAKTYGSLSSVAVRLNDDSEFSPIEKRKLFSLISDVYRTKLNELERQSTDYHINHPKYCDNATFAQKLLLKLVNCKTNQEAIDVYVEFTNYLNYRADVFRTTEQDANKMLKNFLEMIELLQDDSIDVTLLFNKHTTRAST